MQGPQDAAESAAGRTGNGGAERQARSYPQLAASTLPRFRLRRSFPTDRTREPPSASWSVWAQPTPAKRAKRQHSKAQREATAKEKSSRLQFTEEELSTPELEKYMKKSNEAADRLDAAKAAIPKEKKLVKERTFDEATGKGKDPFAL